MRRLIDDWHPFNNETSIFVYNHWAAALSTKNETAIVVFTESL
jgi:hypothetical protein